MGHFFASCVDELARLKDFGYAWRDKCLEQKARVDELWEENQRLTNERDAAVMRGYQLLEYIRCCDAAEEAGEPRPLSPLKMPMSRFISLYAEKARLRNAKDQNRR